MAEIKGLDVYRLSHQWRTAATSKSAMTSNNPQRERTIHRTLFSPDCAEGEEELFEWFSDDGGGVVCAVVVGVGVSAVVVGDGDGVGAL
jgi:hypothetical protein